MRCPACGYEMAPLDKVCARCQGKGTARPKPEPVPPPSEPTPPPQPSVPPTPASTSPATPLAWGAPPPTPGWPPAVPVSPQEDPPNFGYAVLGFVLPEVGFYLWKANRAKFPGKASSAYRGAAWGMGVRVVLAIIIIAVIAAAAKRLQTAFPDISGDGTGVPGMSITIPPFESSDQFKPLEPLASSR